MNIIVYRYRWLYRCWYALSNACNWFVVELWYRIVSHTLIDLSHRFGSVIWSFDCMWSCAVDVVYRCSWLLFMIDCCTCLCLLFGFSAGVHGTHVACHVCCVLMSCRSCMLLALLVVNGTVVFIIYVHCWDSIRGFASLTLWSIRCWYDWLTHIDCGISDRFVDTYYCFHCCLQGWSLRLNHVSVNSLMTFRIRSAVINHYVRSYSELLVAVLGELKGWILSCMPIVICVSLMLYAVHYWMLRIVIFIVDASCCILASIPVVDAHSRPFCGLLSLIVLLVCSADLHGYLPPIASVSLLWLLSLKSEVLFALVFYYCVVLMVVTVELY